MSRRATTDGIAYDVQRSRRSTADIVIERDGSIVVRAPDWADDAKIADVVRSKEYWIYRCLAEWRDLNATRVLREYRNGEGFLYLGRSYRLTLVSDRNGELQLWDGRFHLQRQLIVQGDAEAARGAFRRFYAARGHEKFAARVAYFAPKIGVQFGTIEVRDLGNRWASCSPRGDLAFHWKCMMAPQTIIDYVVVHELCHRRHADHTQAFWNEVDKVMPDHRDRKEWLRKHGAGLDV